MEKTPKMVGKNGKKVFPEETKPGEIICHNYLTERQLSSNEAKKVHIALENSDWKIEDKIIFQLSQKKLIMKFDILVSQISKLLNEEFTSISFTNPYIDQIAIRFYEKFGYPKDVEENLILLGLKT